ncbi:MAG: VanZ family protein [Bacteroidota bacterium]
MHFIRYQLPALLWFVVIYFLSSLPSSVFPVISIPYADKLVHIGIFFILCALVDRALLHQRKFSRLASLHLFVALAIVILYGLSDEFHQSFIPGRTSDLFDATADAIGGCLYILLYSIRKIRMQQ